MSGFTLSRNAFGKLVLADEDGEHEGVVPVRAFPIAAPERGIALVDADGHELAWIEQLSELAPGTRALIEEELKNREFLPEIRRIRSVSTFAVPSTWEVDTDRGEASFVLKGEEDIRRVAESTLLIADTHGVQYLIRDTQALDKGSRKILDRFL
ncbi:cyanophycin metabolism-associated DUF1854 family protein [Noviherbaspirillum aridicola]|uniref:DUF1854 domain-containing protein n=1 Tax=Noviherbaspirillum aridicola TaxID=2849687 RepID=A0ABQ4Q7B0_9BURK|nr:DUF1854 domain-containing protein [Noviherbaspirillum aridicola]GIZ53038.1 hypothetical protein NCCP691_30520 [Noviherbaspirillum aridicola]